MGGCFILKVWVTGQCQLLARGGMGEDDALGMQHETGSGTAVKAVAHDGAVQAQRM